MSDTVPPLKGSQTHANLLRAFAAEAEGNRRYHYFASRAELEGRADVARLFRSAAEAEAGHCNGHMEFLEKVGDPASGLPLGTTRANLAAAIASESDESAAMYPDMARQAREEGFVDIADWFDSLALAEQSHLARFQKALDTLAPA